MNRFDNDPVFGVLLLLVFAALGCFLITLTRKHYQTRHEQIKFFLVALVVRFAASIVIYEFGLVSILGDEDSSGWMTGIYLSGTWSKMNVGLIELPPILINAFREHHQGYAYLVGTLFYLTGTPARLSAAAMNCFLGALTVVFVYRISLSLFSRWVAVRSAWLACFFPSLIIWSAQTLKEPVVILLETVALYACIHLKISGFKIKYILFCGLSIVLLLPFRFYAAYIAALVAFLVLLLPQVSKRKTTLRSALAVAALIVPLAISSGALARNEAQIETFSKFKEIERYKLNVSSGYGSGVENKYNLNSSTGVVMAILVGGAHLMLAPFPWQLGGGSLRMILTAPELIVWWWLFFMGLIPGVYYAVRNRFGEVQPMLFFILGLGLLYSMMFGNVGLIFRQRAQLLPWLLILAMVGIEQRIIKKILKRREKAELPLFAQARQT